VFSENWRQWKASKNIVFRLWQWVQSLFYTLLEPG
jgi:hypothetical protein